jgi:hypothetical protein
MFAVVFVACGFTFVPDGLSDVHVVYTPWTCVWLAGVPLNCNYNGGSFRDVHAVQVAPLKGSMVDQGTETDPKVCSAPGMASSAITATTVTTEMVETFATTEIIVTAGCLVAVQPTSIAAE